MKFKLKKFLLRVPGFIWLCRLLSRHHVRVLMYHRFLETAEPGKPGTARPMLQRQVEYIRAHHQLITTEDHVSNVQSPKKWQDCPVAITIDDGYLDFYKHAYPIFREHEIPVTVFTTTGLIDGTCWFWWDKLFYILENTNQKTAVRTIAEIEVQLDMATQPGRLATQIAISDIMRFLPNQDKFAEIDRLAASFELDLPTMPPREYQGFSWQQIDEMSQHKISFAPHTVNHPILARVPNDEARWEIEESTRRITEKTGQQPQVFCYPQGGLVDFTRDHCKMVAEAGLAGAYIAYQDLEFTKDHYALPRYGVSNNWNQFVWVMCGAEYLLLNIQRIFGHKFQAPDSYWANHKPETD